MQIHIGSVIGSFVILSLIVFLVLAYRHGEELTRKQILLETAKANEIAEAKKIAEDKKLKDQEKLANEPKVRTPRRSITIEQYDALYPQEKIDRDLKKKQAEDFRSMLMKQISKHINALKLTYKQSIYKDNYGNIVTSKWEKEMRHFVKSVIFGKNNYNMVISGDISDFLRVIPNAYEIVNEETVNALKKESFRNPSNVEDMKPLDFEIYCSELLKSDGWSVHLTKKTGDQGVDIVGFFGKTKAVFQCKLYSRPVGNKSVQEISSGKEHEKADLAFVVSNQAYTRAAKELANTNSVHLTHFSELISISKKFAL